jgi:CheY-like chemotaxis protein
MNSVRKKILYVDDDPASRDMMTNWISSNEESFDVTTVNSIVEALDAIERCSYDLFLLDDFLGRGSGVGLCREIRALGSKKPVIIYSGQANQENFERAKAAGVNGYLLKPDDLDMLVPAIRRALGLKPGVFADKIRPRVVQAIL